jgi:ketosteroid isomerase-like protein
VSEQDNRAVAEAFWAAVSAGDLDAAAGHLHPEFVQEWPQSGERIVGAESAMAIDRNFPGGLPSMSVRRIQSAGDLVVSEVELGYADGSRFFGVSVLEFRDGRIVRQTDYFAEPFSPPHWRSQWVERM